MFIIPTAMFSFPIAKFSSVSTSRQVKMFKCLSLIELPSHTICSFAHTVCSFAHKVCSFAFDLSSTVTTSRSIKANQATSVLQEVRTNMGHSQPYMSSWNLNTGMWCALTSSGSVGGSSYLTAQLCDIPVMWWLSYMMSKLCDNSIMMGQMTITTYSHSCRSPVRALVYWHCDQWIDLKQWRAANLHQWACGHQTLQTQAKQHTPNISKSHLSEPDTSHPTCLTGTIPGSCYFYMIYSAHVCTHYKYTKGT